MAKPIYVEPPRQEVVEIEKVEKPKVKQSLDFSPEQSLSRFRTFAPSYSIDYDFAPEEFSATSQIFSPSESYSNVFAPKRSAIKRSVYSPSTINNQKYSPLLTKKIVYRPRLFNKLLAIFAPESILKQKTELKFKPYDYKYQESAIIDTYSPEQITTVEKIAPKDEHSFNLRIAPETDFSIRLSPPPLLITSVDYYGILKKILR